MALPADTPLPRLLAFDIDGTLLPSSGAMSERTVAALRAAEAAGLEVLIATGRRHAYARPIIDPVGLAGETILITSNGAVTRTLGGSRIERAFMDLATARALCGELRPFGGTTVYTFDRTGPGELVLESLSRLHRRVAAWVEANREAILEISPLEDAFLEGVAPIQGMACGTVREMAEAEQHLRASPFADRIEMHCTEYLGHDLSILDILPQGCSKGSALARHAERRGIAQAEVMAVGDNWNDVEMLRWAGQPVLMGNASPELLTRAASEGWTIAPTNDQDGVAQIVEQVLARHTQPTHA